ncbi:MAG: gliding motility-associated C-terminal domain-containing protein [Sphingobacteriaceae bacterium]|nr:gliding motility-associated C-terminal domain-containing protein [Sphingobacteriaceae bacterium]
MKKILLIASILLSGSVVFGQLVTFNYTGAMQQYVVPAGVTGICYTVSGAQGMGNVLNNMNGGLGGRVMGVLSVVPGQVLEIRVGQGGIASNIGGFNGGANGGSSTGNCCPNSRGGGGGGASDIRVAPYALADRVAVGAGGGGTGGNRVQGCSPGCGGGGGGGWYGGGGGGAYGGSPGFGGTQVAGGAGGPSCCGCPAGPTPGGPGVFGNGGVGGLVGCNNQAANNPGCAGGIGGGLIGGQGPNCTGGTGCPSTWAGASGAGGSSYGVAASTPTLFAGVQAGNGQVILNPNCCAAPSLTITATATAVCPAQSTTLTASGAGAGGTYTWLPVNITATTVVVTPTATTVYTVQGATSTSTCSGTQTIQITLNTAPIVAVNNPTACAGSPLLFTANGGTAYTWSGPVAFVSAVQNPTLNNAQVPNAGNYTVTVTGANGCTNAAISSASVANIPLPTTVGNNTVCSQGFNGSTNTVALQAMGGNTYTWTNAAGFFPPSSVGPNFITTAPVTPIPIVGDVTVTITGALGCTAQAVHNITVIPNPVLVFAPAQPTLCFGKSTPISVSGASTYVWASGVTLNTTTGSLVVASPTANTTYTVVGSALGCNSDFHYITATVVANPTVLIASGTASICYGSSLVMNAIGATTYSWYPNSAISNTFMNSVVVNPLSIQQYTVVGEVNTCTAIAIREVTVIPLPTLQAMASKSIICSGEVATINANGASNYQWTPIAGIIGSSTTNFISVSPVVSTTYNLVGLNGACTGTAVVPITVVPRAELNLATTNNKICEGNSTTIFASGSQYFIWTPTLSINQLNPNTASVNPQVTTNYTVLAYNTIGTKTCNITKEIEIQVVAKIIPSISGNVIICEGESVKLTASGSDTYQWIPPTGLNVTDKSTVYANPKFTTTYTVTISNGGDCGEVANVQVKVNPNPTVTAGPDLLFNLDDPMYLDAKGTGTLTWIFGQDIVCSVCPNSQILPKTSGCYQIQAVNDFGCKATDDVCVEVTANYNMYIPNIFTPNDDGKNDLFTVYGTGFNKIEISIFDRWGAKLYTTTDIAKGWDGTFKGVLSKEDTYVYKVNFTTLDGKKHTKTGHVTLLK